MGPAGLDRQEAADNVHIEVPPKVGKFDIGELIRVVDACIVDQHVQPTKRLESYLDQPRGSLRGRDVRGVSHNRPTGGAYSFGSVSGWSDISTASVDSDSQVIDNYVRATRRQ
jgi:hypothetical protein